MLEKGAFAPVPRSIRLVKDKKCRRKRKHMREVPTWKCGRHGKTEVVNPNQRMTGAIRNVFLLHLAPLGIIRLIGYARAEHRGI